LFRDTADCLRHWQGDEPSSVIAAGQAVSTPNLERYVAEREDPGFTGYTTTGERFFGSVSAFWHALGRTDVFICCGSARRLAMLVDLGSKILYF
jgi:hypothetical protein